MPDGERMKEVDQEGYKYLGALQLDKIMNKEMKENVGNEYIRSEIDLQVKSKFHLWHECLSYRCDKVQWRNYRLDKRGTSGHGPEN